MPKKKAVFEKKRENRRRFLRSLAVKRAMKGHQKRPPRSR